MRPTLNEHKVFNKTFVHLVCISSAFIVLAATVTVSCRYINFIDFAMLPGAALAVVLGALFGWKGRYDLVYHKTADIFALIPMVLSLFSLVYEGVSAGAVPAAPWYYSLWSVIGLALLWSFPPDNRITAAAAVVAFTGLIKIFAFRKIYLVYTPGVMIFLNSHFLAGMLADSCFMMLYWRPPWKRGTRVHPIFSTSGWLIPAGMVLGAIMLGHNSWFFHNRYTDIIRFAVSGMAMLVGIILCVSSLSRATRSALQAGLFFFCLGTVLLLFNYMSINLHESDLFTHSFFKIRSAIIVLALFGCLMNRVFSYTPRVNSLITITGISAFLNLCIQEIAKLNNYLENPLIVLLLISIAFLLYVFGSLKKLPAIRYYSFVLWLVASGWLIYTMFSRFGTQSWLLAAMLYTIILSCGVLFFKLRKPRLGKPGATI
ncbi:hypothetical protein P0136_06590 [Lentisphaerota bacterium ZTH]|nr:hypothetical protein JYG24_02300 [Lentisphaerota bacterium]WET07657.1 hypothetical protein P0136_06590 [Lentisphaerota bacterium ZTH]